jgi:RNA polymerase sigma-70 factor, ECF subfamily
LPQVGGAESLFRGDTMTDDAAAIRQCLSGNTDSYRLLVERHSPGVRAWLIGRVATLDLVDEATQETFVRAYVRLGGLRSHESFAAWIIGIADRTAKELTRRARRAGRTGSEHAGDAAGIAAEDGAEGAALIVASDISREVDALPEPYRTTVLLRYYAGLSCPQVSARLGESVGTVTKRLSRAHDLLRESIGRRRRTESESGVIGAASGRANATEVAHALRRVS